MKGLTARKGRFIFLSYRGHTTLKESYMPHRESIFYLST
jgi:hypothetical protein